jgi:hypothetical protein
MKKKSNQLQSHKMGRNDLCPCGSGKKYKKCCLIKKMIQEQAMAIAHAQTQISAHVHTEECNHDHGPEANSQSTAK